MLTQSDARIESTQLCRRHEQMPRSYYPPMYTNGAVFDIKRSRQVSYSLRSSQTPRHASRYSNIMPRRPTKKDLWCPVTSGCIAQSISTLSTTRPTLALKFYAIREQLREQLHKFPAPASGLLVPWRSLAADRGSALRQARLANLSQSSKRVENISELTFRKK